MSAKRINSIDYFFRGEERVTDSNVGHEKREEKSVRPADGIVIRPSSAVEHIPHDNWVGGGEIYEFTRGYIREENVGRVSTKISIRRDDEYDEAVAEETAELDEDVAERESDGVIVRPISTGRIRGSECGKHVSYLNTEH